MPIKCKRGIPSCRYRKISKGRKQRLCGCMKKGRFVKIKEVKTYEK